MIFESYHWKGAILEYSERVSKGKRAKDELSELEQDILLGFFSIRKLWDARLKLSNEVIQSRIDVSTHNYVGADIINLFNRHDLQRFYNFDKKESRTFSLKKLCEQFVHSYIFEFVVNEDEDVDGVIVASDYDRHKFCIEMSLSEICDIFESIANDNADTLQCNLKDGEYIRCVDGVLSFPS